MNNFIETLRVFEKWLVLALLLNVLTLGISSHYDQKGKAKPSKSEIKYSNHYNKIVSHCEAILDLPEYKSSKCSQLISTLKKPAEYEPIRMSYTTTVAFILLGLLTVLFALPMVVDRMSGKGERYYAD